MSRRASIVSISHFISIWSTIVVVKIISRRALLVRRMGSVRTTYAMIRGYSASAAMNSVNGSYSRRRYRNWASRGRQARR